MKKIILALVFFANCLLPIANCVATNVSGGIYSNTTWTFVNSPYIVTDTVVVFPGVTLTIEAGVVVKFADGKYMELRQAAMMAIGTITDSITFTSNSSNPTSGSWGDIFNGGIYLNSYLAHVSSKFSFCNFYYATAGIDDFGGYDSLTVNNSNFKNNGTGINSNSTNVFIDSCIFMHNWAGIAGIASSISNCTFKSNTYGCGESNLFNPLRMGQLSNCIFESNQTGLCVNGYVANCIVKYNQTGVTGDGGKTVENCIIDSNFTVGVIVSGDCGIDSVFNCQIKYNGIGVQDGGTWDVVTKNDIEFNTTGIYNGGGPIIFCNKICNNTSFDFELGYIINYLIAHNDWGTTDSATIESHIYDGYDNISLGLVHFMPVDSTQCFLHTSCSANFYLYPDSFVLHHYWIIDSSSGTGSLSYLWNWGDTHYDSIPYPSHTYADSGFYNIYLTITDSVGCSSSFCYNSFHILRTTNTMYWVDVRNPNLTTGIKDNTPINHCTIFPNPNDGNFVVAYHLSASNAQLRISDIAGRIINTYSISGKEGTQNINATNLSKGIYFWEMISDNGVLDKGKMIKE